MITYESTKLLNRISNKKQSAFYTYEQQWL